MPAPRERGILPTHAVGSPASVESQRRRAVMPIPPARHMASPRPQRGAEPAASPWQGAALPIPAPGRAAAPRRLAPRFSAGCHSRLRTRCTPWGGGARAPRSSGMVSSPRGRNVQAAHPVARHRCTSPVFSPVFDRGVIRLTPRMPISDPSSANISAIPDCGRADTQCSTSVLDFGSTRDAVQVRGARGGRAHVRPIGQGQRPTQR